MSKATDRLSPNPKATVDAIRAIGYSFESALADIVDNSIPVMSSSISIVAHWDGSDSWCAILDDGYGMTEESLREAMRVGSNGGLEHRNQNDLGKFGMGLKSAGFSQARRITVISKTKTTKPCQRTWDIDYMEQSGEWDALLECSEFASKFAEKNLGLQGTIVFLEKLDGPLDVIGSKSSDPERQSIFLQQVSSLTIHLGMVFGRIMTQNKKLRVTVNGSEIVPWLPYFEHSATQDCPDETLTLKGSKIRCRSYVLPHPERLTSQSEMEEMSGPGGLTFNQGFYIYRKDRLIMHGIWFERKHVKDRDHNLARLEIDIPEALDKDWGLTVDKGRVSPPKAMSGELRRLADRVRAKSQAVYRSRGKTNSVRRTPSGPVTPVLEIKTRHGKKIVEVNVKHPLVSQVLAGSDSRSTKAFLGIFNESLQILLNQTQEIDVSLAEQREENPPLGLRECVEILFETFANEGKLNRNEIKKKLLTIDPIFRYPNIVEEVMGDDFE